MAGGSVIPFDAAAPLQLEFSAPAGVYNEVYDASGALRPHWAAFYRAARKEYAADLYLRLDRASRQLAENGVNFSAVSDAAEVRRPWLLDLIPMILGAAEWEAVSRGLAQRSRLLEALIRDIYGPRRLIRERILPADLLFAHPGFRRSFDGLHTEHSPSLLISGAELARSGNGDWQVMADRTMAPVGLGFALENRIVANRYAPSWMHRFSIQRLAPFFLRLQNAIAGAVHRVIDRPRIVILASGAGHPYHFEDAYLARYLGYTLVEGGDIAVRDEKVFMKTLAGLVPVDAILFRGSEHGVDPLELGGHSASGSPGLLQAVRKRSVALFNTPGCGMLEAPVLMSFLPTLCKTLLGEELLLPSVQTYWCGDSNTRQHVYTHWQDLVIKPAFAPSGSEEIFPGKLSMEESEALKRRIEQRPYHFVAQELIQRSAVPVWSDQGVKAGHAAVRAFLVQEANDFHVMPGALIRVASDTAPMELSISAGNCSKDLWVLAEKSVEKVSLLAPPDRPAELRRTSALFPSRVADNLFWLGHSFDRATYLARAIRTLSDRMMSENELDFPAIPALVRLLADQGQLEPGLAVLELQKQLPDLDRALAASLFDHAEHTTLASALREVVRLAQLVRDWISPETWQILSQAPEKFLSQGSQAKELSDTSTLLNSLSIDLASASGLMHDGMIRGPAWRFLDMGRRIERGRNVCRMAIAFHQGKMLSEISVLKAILQIVDCRMTYRTRYLDNFQRNAVLDLCITDDTNPQSLIFQVEALSSHVDALPHDPAMPLRTHEKRLAMSALHALRMTTTDQLANVKGVELFTTLHLVENKLRELSDMLTRTYLLHSGEPRQLLELEARS